MHVHLGVLELLKTHQKNPKVQIIHDEIDTEYLSIIDVEDDFSAPIFVQHTEAMLYEIEKMVI